MTSKLPSLSKCPPWPDIRGGMAGLIRNHEWRHSPLGAANNWPQSLKTAVELMLLSHQPTSICWGRGLITLYNDACIPLLKNRHPACLGRPYGEVWPDSWDDVKPAVDATLKGEPQQLVGHRIRRSGKDDQASWFTWSWSPLCDDSGQIAGIYCTAAETTLQLGDDQLRTILENTHDGVFMQDIRSRKYLYVSPALAGLTGFSLDELRNMPESERRERTHPEDRAHIVKEIDALVCGGNDEAVTEHRWMVKSGEYRCLSVSGKVVRDPSGRPSAIVGICRDVTERRKNEEALRNSETRLNLALDIAQMGMWEWNTKTGKAIWNAKLSQILGLPEMPEERDAQTFFRMVHSDDLGPLTASLKEALESRSEWRGEFRIVRTDGAVRRLSAVSHILRSDDGSARGMIGVNFDVSEQRQAEAALQESETRSRLLQEELMHVGRVSELSQVSAGIAHELNQPLAAMLNYSATAKRLITNRDEASVKAAHTFIAKAGEQAERAAEIIRRMRDFVEKRQTDRRAGAINAIIKDAVALGLIGAKAAGIDTRFKLSPDLPEVLVDRVQIQQVLVNLLRNAIDAMSQSEKRELTLTTSRCNGHVEVAVTDTGCGIPEHMREKLFHPFVTTKPGGMGIGLAISQSIVEAHNGSIAAEANPGGGTIFRFTLPPTGP